MSSTHEGNSASACIDGNYQFGTYCHTSVGISGAWFKVAVSGDYVVNKVVIFPSLIYDTHQIGLSRSSLIYSNDPDGTKSVIYKTAIDPTSVMGKYNLTITFDFASTS